MVFSSIAFLCFFLPICLAGHLLLPARGRWRSIWLLLCSAAFYIWAEARTLPLILLCGAWVYGAGLWLKRAKKQSVRKAAVACGSALPMLALLYYKYAGFFASNLNSLLGTGLPIVRAALPVGISFYTFQMVSYLVDLYRGGEGARDLLDWYGYVLYFPKMTAGPITRYAELQPCLRTQKTTLEGFSEGAWRFCIGLGKKAILSASLGELTAGFAASAERSALYCWLYALGVALQVYYDFSGYSDMALGLAEMLGMKLPQNFDYPFASRSASELWRRWHMSLGAWFRDYIYIPLGGSRRGTGRLILALGAVWLCTGLWHGADWGYICWGVFFGGVIILEKLWLGKLLKKLPALFGHLYVALLVLISFVVFGGMPFGGSLQVIGGMFTGGNAGAEGLYALRNFGVLLAVSVLGAMPFGRVLRARLERTRKGKTAVLLLRPLWAALVLVLSVAWLADGSFSPFLYFRF